MRKRSLKLLKETVVELGPAELERVAAGTVTFVHLQCHPTFRLECSAVLECKKTH